MEIRKEFYLPNRGVLSLYNISYLENEFNLVTDKISESLGNITVDINKRLLSSFNHLRKIKIKDEKVIRNEYPDIYRIYLQENPFLKPLTSINYGYDIISFKGIDTFLRENNSPDYLKAL